MSWKISGACWDLDLPANKLLVLLAMADHADHEGNNVFPSMALIAWKTGYSERQVRRIVKALVADGILVERVKETGKVTRYSINLAAGKPKPPRQRPGQNDTPDKMSYHPGQNVLPTPDIQMSDEPSLEPINKPIVASEAATVAADKPDKQPLQEKTEKERNPLFDAVAIHVFGIDAGLVNGDGGRVGAIAAWLGGKSDGTKRGRSKKEVVGYISKPATPEHIRKFVAWYMSKHTASVPRDFSKFVEYWRQWATETNKQQARRSQPVAQMDAPRQRTAEEQAQIEAMLKDIRPEWEKDAA